MQARLALSEEQPMRNILAVGPPRSVRTPWTSGRACTSRSTLPMVREVTTLPWWAVSAQKRQPPAQPRLTTTLPRTVLRAGMG